ncbi:MAG TPA: replicative DNA helicase, partial [Bacillota bacterium]|nr:replicative DNA helicase [Bacillota bacterium]
PIDLSTRIAAMGYDEGEEPEKLIAEAERMLMELGSRRVASAFFSIKDILLNTFSHLEYLYNNRGSITGVPTSFSDLDRLCSGLQPSDFIILAGRPSMGKTSLGLCIAYNAALKHNIPVAIFSLEMSKEQLVQRILCAEARVDQHRIRSGDLDEDDWRKLHETARVLAKAPIYIDDTPALSVRQVRAKARQLKAEKGLGLILIDYLQMMTGSRRSENRQQEISEISRSLKGLAKELNIPVLALAQLSRSVEQRPNKRPVMSDLRESGSLEQDADLIMFIYRDEYYNPDSEKKGIAEIIISKHRNGPVGTVELVFLKELTKFVPYLKDAGGV